MDPDEYPDLTGLEYLVTLALNGYRVTFFKGYSYKYWVPTIEYIAGSNTFYRKDLTGVVSFIDNADSIYSPVVTGELNRITNLFHTLLLERKKIQLSPLGVGSHV